MSNNCLLCGTIASVNHDDDDYLEQRFNYNCPNCGKYSASDIFIKLACLSEEEKKLLWMHYKEKKTLQCIADEIGLSEIAIKKKHRKMLMKIGRMI